MRQKFQDLRAKTLEKMDTFATPLTPRRGMLRSPGTRTYKKLQNEETISEGEGKEKEKENLDEIVLAPDSPAVFPVAEEMTSRGTTPPVAVASQHLQATVAVPEEDREVRVDLRGQKTATSHNHRTDSSTEPIEQGNNVRIK